ncbi:MULTISPECIES: hypothetical protein [unclassified Okeania]|nr:MULTISPECIES: hypothetical protein [unclassified Okeania]NES76667.1 hypothetical protein [Okeania sp. SIO1H4]NET20298.1 hypothetical protein [Okeania sp. SIO1H5]NET96792.1 hypothetical protein [Okeania sp. SIO1H2]
MVKLGGVNPPLTPPRRGSQESGVRRRENYKDERSYDYWIIFLCPIKRI